jgi:transcriptional pleiotropic regulator of transition state genes
MKATGIVRKLDVLGRIVLPIELRKTLGIEVKDPMEIYVDNDFIILRKYSPQCCLCGSMGSIKHYKGKNICMKCISQLSIE